MARAKRRTWDPEAHEVSVAQAEQNGVPLWREPPPPGQEAEGGATSILGSCLRLGLWPHS